MLKELFQGGKFNEKVLRICAIIIIIAVIILSFSVFTESKDGRRQIVDDGGVEAELCSILTDIEGVGDCRVMLTYEDDKVTGAIVTATGASDPVVRNNVINAVMAVFNIPASSVEVFEREESNEE